MFHSTLKTFCPVCKDFLGLRHKDSLADFYCKECDTTFYWHPKDKVPTNSRTHPKADKCGCAICGR